MSDEGLAEAEALAQTGPASARLERLAEVLLDVGARDATRAGIDLLDIAREIGNS